MYFEENAALTLQNEGLARPIGLGSVHEIRLDVQKPSSAHVSH